MGSLHGFGEPVHADHQHVRVIPALIKSRKAVHDDRLVVLRRHAGRIIVLPGSPAGIAVAADAERDIVKNPPGIAHLVAPVLRVRLPPLADGIDDVVAGHGAVQLLKKRRVGAKRIFLPAVVHQAKHVAACCQVNINVNRAENRIAGRLRHETVILHRPVAVADRHLEPASLAFLLGRRILDAKRITSALGHLKVINKLAASVAYRRSRRPGSVKRSEVGDTAVLLRSTKAGKLPVLRRKTLLKTVTQNRHALNVRRVDVLRVPSVGKCGVIPQIIAIIHFDEIDLPVGVGLRIRCLVAAGTDVSAAAEIRADVVIHAEQKSALMHVIRHGVKARRKRLRVRCKLSVHPLRQVAAVV